MYKIEVVFVHGCPNGALCESRGEGKQGLLVKVQAACFSWCITFLVVLWLVLLFCPPSSPCIGIVFATPACITSTGILIDLDF